MEGRNKRRPRKGRAPDPIYLDQAATSFPKPPAVAEAMHKALTESAASPGRSAHRYSLHAARVIFEARELMARLFSAEDSSRIAFTANVTQALNMALLGLLGPGDHVLTTGLEHNAVMRPLRWLAEKRGVEFTVVDCPAGGPADPADFARLKTARTRLAVVNHASNVTGTIQPLAEIKAALGEIPMIVDAAQTAGALPLSVAATRADVLAFTGHKALYGPTGTGGLWIRPGLEIEPVLRGGTGSRSEHETQPDFMPDRLEAGTPNTVGLAGLAAGLDFVLATGVDVIREHERRLTARFLQGLADVPGATVYGPPDADSRVAVVSLGLEGWSPSDLARSLERDFGLLTRPGLDCAPRAHRTIGTFPRGTTRFSFGFFNTLSEIDAALEVLSRLARQA
jgi:cysteine desulfurase/selenocysteine lyase